MLECLPVNVDNIVKAACVLHNYLRKADLAAAPNMRQYCPPGFTDSEDADGIVLPGAWRDSDNPEAFRRLENGPHQHHQGNAVIVREMFEAYFSAAGKIGWQDSVVD